jgi:uncharacterized alpha/beta hydrolase family protein
VVPDGVAHKFIDYMKPLEDNKVLDELKRQIKAEEEYNRPFKEARETVAKRVKERESEYQKFKRFQTKQYEDNEKLKVFLSKKS